MEWQNTNTHETQQLELQLQRDKEADDFQEPPDKTNGFYRPSFDFSLQEVSDLRAKEEFRFTKSQIYKIADLLGPNDSECTQNYDFRRSPPPFLVPFFFLLRGLGFSDCLMLFL